MNDNYEVEIMDDWKTWDQFVKDSPGGTVFSTSAWLSAARKSTGGDIVIYGCYKKGNLIAGCSGLRTKKARLDRFTTPILTPYGGFIYAHIPAIRAAKVEAERQKATAGIITRLESDFDYILLSHSPDIEDIREFIWRDWQILVKYTYRIDLSEADKLWSAFENRTNTVIRKAQKNCFSIHQKDDLNLFICQYKMIYEKRRLQPVPDRIVDVFHRAAQESGLCSMYTAEEPSGATVSTVVFVQGFETLYAWIAGADPEYNSSGATSLLYSEVFKEMSSQCHSFDFVGANIPSIAKFKRGFGGVLTPYYVTEKYTSSMSKAILKTGRKIKSLTRR